MYPLHRLPRHPRAQLPWWSGSDGILYFENPELPPAQGERHYFAYIEEIEAISPRHTYVGPADDPMELSLFRQFEPRPWPINIRFSGIEAETFSALMDQFEPLDPNDATLEQRRQRRHDIVRLLSHVDLPIFQAIIPANDSIWLRLREYWREGHWCRLNMLPRQQAEGPRYLFMAVPEHGEQTSQPLQLTSIASIDEYHLRRLEDIFSLVHLPDADFRGEATPGANHPPTPPPRGDTVIPPWSPDLPKDSTPDIGIVPNPSKPSRKRRPPTKRTPTLDPAIKMPQADGAVAHVQAPMLVARKTPTTADSAEVLEQPTAFNEVISYFIATRQEET